MTINPSGWRPEMNAAEAAGPGTYTGNKGLMLEEPLIFEIAGNETTGVDFEILPELARGGGSREATDGGGPRPNAT